MLNGSLSKEHEEAPTAPTSSQLSQSKAKGRRPHLTDFSNGPKVINETRPIKRRVWSKGVEGRVEIKLIASEALAKAARIISNSHLPQYNEFSCPCCLARLFSAQQLFNHQWLTSEEETHKNFEQKKVKPEPSAIAMVRPMKTLTALDRDAIARGMHRVCEAVGWK